MGSIAETRYRTLPSIVDGRLVAGPKIGGGTRGDTVATRLAISADEPELNAVLVRGSRSAFTLADSRIALSGIGKSDFLGIGAGAMAVSSMVVLRDVDIETAEAARSAVVAADGAVMRSTIRGWSHTAARFRRTTRPASDLE